MLRDLDTGRKSDMATQREPAVKPVKKPIIEINSQNEQEESKDEIAEDNVPLLL
jgi:hypothetical protein